jgi:hypothetical protein
MSGAAANSAARRRRGTGTGTGEPAYIEQPPDAHQRVQPNRIPHPMQILEDHEIRLRQIEANKGHETSKSSNIDVSMLNSLLERISLLETNPSNTGNDSESLDIKSQLLKIQTFSIETTTLVMKLQKEIDILTTGSKSALERITLLEDASKNIDKDNAENKTEVISEEAVST